MQAREFYAPSRTTMSPEAEFARWTRRLSIQSELGSAREMAGLSDAELETLEREFIRCPTRPRAAWARHGLWAGGVLIALACTGFAVADMAAVDDAAARALTLFGLGLLLAGLTAMAVSGLAAFGSVPLDLHYGTAGLYVGLLDEQHPWLYGAAGLMRHEAAESYRLSVLRERGRLRGLDYVVMRELVKAQDQLERMRPARAVADQLQSQSACVEPSPVEPRLVQVGSAASDIGPWTRERGAITVEAA